MFDEIYSKLIKSPKKQFKKIAVEGIQSAMNQIELLYTNVGYCRESEYDIETEDIEHWNEHDYDKDWWWFATEFTKI